MVSHLVIALWLLAAVLAAGVLVQRTARRHANRLVGVVTEEEAGVPTILYFTSEECAPCRLRQTPALKELGTRAEGRFTLRVIDVAGDVETARRYRVMSAPTTVVVDPTGAVRAVNVGVASAETLETQL